MVTTNKNDVMNTINKNYSQLIIGKWMHFFSKYEYNIINNLTIECVLDLFKEEVIEKLENNVSILVQFRICSSDRKVYRNMSTIERYTKSDFNDVYDIYKMYWELQRDEYMDMIDDPRIIIAYNIVPVEIEFTNVNKSIIRKNTLFNRSNNTNVNSQKIKGYSLPNTMDFRKWGECDINPEYTKASINKQGIGKYELDIMDNELNVNLIVNNNIIFSFNDKRCANDSLQTFTRIIKIKKKKTIYKYINGEIVLKIKDKILKKISKINLDANYKEDFITMDLETRTFKGEMSAYSCSNYDGSNLNSFYLTDFSNDEELLIKGIKSLFKRKFKGLNVYLHNFSNFDSVFLLSILSKLSLGIKPIINDSNFIDLIVKFSDKCNIKYKDSYLILPSSLSKLSKAFDVKKKGIFPYKFVSDKNNLVPLDYIGKVPAIEYFEDKDKGIELNKEDYDLYVQDYNNDWDLKKETIKQCNNDVKILYDIIKQFNLKIYNEFRINAIKYPTLSSLSFAIYRSNFMEDSYDITKIYGDIYNFIRKGYTGGAVDVYIHKSEINQKVYRYDINSLYPYVMLTFDMPVGNPRYFEGDIYLMEENPFGFFEVEVEAPKNLKHPILLMKSQNKKFKHRTIAPLGKWKGVYFSEEIENAKKYGYNFKVLKGYTFERRKIFTEYVNKFYDIKRSCAKNDPWYIIAKLLLNGLYGKFGMCPYKDKHEIIDNDELYKYVDNFKVSSTLDLKNNKQLISYSDDNESDEDYSTTPNVNISISAAITAYGRIVMSKYKNRNDFNLFYSDTDCIDIDRPLEDINAVGPEIGKMKLEHIFSKIVYVAPKVYGGYSITKNKEISKIKGLKIKNFPFEKLEKLLDLNNNLPPIKQDKWYKDISNRKIDVIEENYTLMVTGNKRKINYNKENQIINSEPFIIDEIDDIN